MLPAMPRAAHAPYELWREDGLLRVELTAQARIGRWEMCELIRLAEAMDPQGSMPLLVMLGPQVRVSPDARTLLVRCSKRRGRAVAFIAAELADRLQGEFFLRFHKPAFPFRVCAEVHEALAWIARWKPQLMPLPRSPSDC
ncbi:MAG: hypothetical protein IPH53_00465 [Flavobacteriales bacterium]|nr:hypothetical protein [Flavobacteriales bacterium]MBK7083214.1 hypothetical protein [Flavobacteriales bacterium]MBK7752962.1 hypothetical protein [Flavobacteriales bacterium]MBK9076282.1 hypothetical protein [Flavobacteriales bacterium]MBK9540436.1 hypothetical protein [Flavobacteriales bacterium]